jgi:hypothetical protein
MARKLTKRQKEILDRLFEDSGVTDIYDAPESVQSLLVGINDYETIWQDANRYLMDLHFEKMNGT